MADIERVLSDSLNSFRRYYNIETENVLEPFKATATFMSHNEQYYLVKAAKIADIDSNEYVYFACEDELSKEKLENLCNKAWEDGLSKVVPSYGHRNTDVTVVLLCNSIPDEVFDSVKKIKKYKSYKFTFYGWSHFKLIAMDVSLKRLTTNRQGQPLKKVFNNIKNNL